MMKNVSYRNKEAETSHTDNLDKNTTKSEDYFLVAMSQN